ncbi:hypothetical protein EDD86DRAFT_202329 [Gorgonomyces haynaldii]|nr:hypothetical protein EDD86DRAFT_202329 [Gorgonomyces haynaldii]
MLAQFLAAMRLLLTCPYHFVKYDNLNDLPPWIDGQSLNGRQLGRRLVFLCWTLQQWAHIYSRASLRSLMFGHVMYLLNPQTLLVSRFHSIETLKSESVWILVLSSVEHLASIVKKKHYKISGTDTEGECMICLESGPMQTYCNGHKAHEHCMNNWVQKSPTCPMCRRMIRLETAGWREFRLEWLEYKLWIKKMRSYCVYLCVTHLICVSRFWYHSFLWKHILSVE